jgi:hypothetical protein
VAGTLGREELLARDYTVDVGDYLGRSWEMFKANAGPLIGATVLIYLIFIVSGMIPYLGSLASLILGGPLLGGLWWFYVKQVRTEGPVVGDAFSGFGPRFGQLLLGYVVPAILAYLCMLPFVVVMVGVGLVSFASGQGGDGGGMSTASILGIGLAVVLGLVGFAGFMYLTIGWFFTLPLVIDKGMRFWPAMVLGRAVVGKHWWRTLWLSIAAGVVAMLGMLACGVGLLVTGPVAMGMLTFHYQNVFGDLRAGIE